MIGSGMGYGTLRGDAIMTMCMGLIRIMNFGLADRLAERN